jgi:hypothetical protein
VVRADISHICLSEVTEEEVFCSPCCNSYGVVSPLETLPMRFKWGSSLPPDCFISRGSVSHLSVFLEETIQEK